MPGGAIAEQHAGWIYPKQKGSASSLPRSHGSRKETDSLCSKKKKKKRNGCGREFIFVCGIWFTSTLWWCCVFLIAETARLTSTTLGRNSLYWLTAHGSQKHGGGPRRRQSQLEPQPRFFLQRPTISYYYLQGPASYRLCIPQ